MVNFQNIDCAELLQTVPDNSIDLFCEDMPFNTTSCHFEYEVDLAKYWADRLPKLKEGGKFVLFGTGLFAFHNVRQLDAVGDFETQILIKQLK